MLTLPDGYNGHTARYYPYARDVMDGGRTVKLQRADTGKTYMHRWARQGDLAGFVTIRQNGQACTVTRLAFYRQLRKIQKRNLRAR